MSCVNALRILAAVAAACFLFAPSVGAEERQSRSALACDLCDGLLAKVTGPAGTPYLFRSFEPSNAGSALHPSLENVAFTYDNAVALMALYGCGQAKEARRVADALVLALNADRFYSDGRLRNAYRSGALELVENKMALPGYWSDGENRWVEDSYQVGSAVGSTAWAALALLVAYQQTGDDIFLDSAAKIVAWINEATRDPVDPGFFGGFFGHEPEPTRQTWKSTEHNTDVFAANAWLGALDREGGWDAEATHARRFIDAMWDETSGHYWIGTVPGKMSPNTGASGLDALLWPLTAIPGGKASVDSSLSWAETHHGVPGGFDFNDDRDGVWLEGTAQAAQAYRLLGRPEKAEPLFATIRGSLSKDKLVFATQKDELTTGLEIGPGSAPGDFKYYRLPHIGATSWAVLAAIDWNPFVPEMQRPMDRSKTCPQK